jgi:hypothetical protein
VEVQLLKLTLCPAVLNSTSTTNFDCPTDGLQAVAQARNGIAAFNPLAAKLNM